MEYGVEEFCRLHRELRTPFEKALGISDIVDKDAPTVLWILQMAYQTKLYPDPSRKRVFFTDYFYNRQTLAKELQGITDNEARLIETVKFTNVNVKNCRLFIKAISRIKNASRGSWCLVRTYDKISDLEKLRMKHVDAAKNKPGNQRTQFISPTELVQKMRNSLSGKKENWFCCIQTI